MSEFITPLNHYNFKAKKINLEIKGKISDCSIAYIESQGGGPEPSHTHLHDHFFIVVEGTATIKIGEEKINVGMDESIIVPGSAVHSIWNDTDKPLKMIGITVQPEK